HRPPAPPAGSTARRFRPPAPPPAGSARRLRPPGQLVGRWPALPAGRTAILRPYGGRVTDLLGAAPAAPTRVLDRRLRATTIGLVSIVTLIAFEAMAVATALPTAVRDLDGLAYYGWSFTAFLIANIVGMVAAGEL